MVAVILFQHDYVVGISLFSSLTEARAHAATLKAADTENIFSPKVVFPDMPDALLAYVQNETLAYNEDE